MLVGLILLMIFFETKELQRKQFKRPFKVLAFRAVIITILILLTFNLKAGNVVYETGSLTTPTYDNSTGRLIDVDSQIVYSAIPLYQELSIIGFALMIFYAYRIASTFLRGDYNE